MGKTTEHKLRAMGIRTVRDLLLHLPFRHEPPSRVAGVAGICVGEEMTLRVQVVSCAVRETARRRVKVLEALVSDDTGSVLATWYNQAYLEAAFRERPEVLLKGCWSRQRGASTFLVKRHEILERGRREPPHPGPGARVSEHRRSERADHPHHSARSGAPRAQPASILFRPNCWPGGATRREAEAVLACHFPEQPSGRLQRARERLAFEELLLLQIAVLEQRQVQGWAAPGACSGSPGGARDRILRGGLPVRAHERPDAGDRRDRRGSGADRAHAAAAARRCRLGQDHGGGVLPAAGRGARGPGGADGSNRGAGRPALPRAVGAAAGLGGEGPSAQGQPVRRRAARACEEGYRESARPMWWWGRTP